MQGIHILVVGIGNWLQKFELQSIASHPDSKNIKYINSYDNLGDHVEFFKLYNCKRWYYYFNIILLLGIIIIIIYIYYIFIFIYYTI